MNCTALLFRYLSDHIGVTSLFNRKYSMSTEIDNVSKIIKH